MVVVGERRMKSNLNPVSARKKMPVVFWNEVWWVQNHLLNLIYKPGELHLLMLFFLCLQTRLSWAYLNCKNGHFFLVL